MYTIYADVATYQWKVHNGLMVFTKQPSTREVMTEEMIVIKPKKTRKRVTWILCYLCISCRFYIYGDTFSYLIIPCHSVVVENLQNHKWILVLIFTDYTEKNDYIQTHERQLMTISCLLETNYYFPMPYYNA
jgi:hypothetical protein